MSDESLISLNNEFEEDPMKENTEAIYRARKKRVLDAIKLMDQTEYRSQPLSVHSLPDMEKNYE